MSALIRQAGELLNRGEYLLACLVEECSELQKEATKSLKFGLHDRYYEKTSAEKMSDELNDVLAVVRMLEQEEIWVPEINEEAIQTKIKRVEKYIKYSMERGVITEE